MALAPVALGLAGASLTVAAVDRISKRLASPGVANDGLPEVQGGNSPAGCPDVTVLVHIQKDIVKRLRSYVNADRQFQSQMKGEMDCNMDCDDDLVQCSAVSTNLFFGASFLGGGILMAFGLLVVVPYFFGHHAEDDGFSFDMRAAYIEPFPTEEQRRKKESKRRRFFWQDKYQPPDIVEIETWLRHVTAMISRYSQKADNVDQSALRRLAAPVASWIAYCPRGRIPTVAEFRLLTKFMDKMDGELLPSRLNDVLRDMQAVLRSLPRPADVAWAKAETRLQTSYRKLRRRCRETAAGTVTVARHEDIVAAELTAEQDEALQVRDTDDSRSARASALSDQHLTLFRKINEWSFLDNAQKLERLQQAEVASRRSRRSLGQEELADVLNMAAACLAGPRRHAKVQDADAKDTGEVRAAPESQDPAVDLQKRIRSLFLQALHMWQMNQFDCQAIEHVLDCVQQKISNFESKVGEIQGAAAGKAWLKIKQVVDHLLQVETHSKPKPHVQSAAKALAESAHRVGVRLERQSGIQNISWYVKDASWKCKRTYTRGGVRKASARYFAISKFLEQGLGEEAAVEAALQEAKAYREELVRQGKLKPPKPKPPRSTVRGVVFHKGHQKWQVRLYHPVTKKALNSGTYSVMEEAEVKARQMARQLGVRPEYEVRPAKRRRAEVPGEE
ncbi:unnamed protein product [Symbiodinium sp. CCMP2456]|nr:unnamed protein product [Symbiodinium sp. CCMP2456]